MPTRKQLIDDIKNATNYVSKVASLNRYIASEYRDKVADLKDDFEPEDPPKDVVVAFLTKSAPDDEDPDDEEKRQFNKGYKRSVRQIVQSIKNERQVFIEKIRDAKDTAAKTASMNAYIKNEYRDVGEDFELKDPPNDVVVAFFNKKPGIATSARFNTAYRAAVLKIVRGLNEMIDEIKASLPQAAKPSSETSPKTSPKTGSDTDDDEDRTKVFNRKRRSSFSLFLKTLKEYFGNNGLLGLVFGYRTYNILKFLMIKYSPWRHLQATVIVLYSALNPWMAYQRARNRIHFFPSDTDALSWMETKPIEVRVRAKALAFVTSASISLVSLMSIVAGIGAIQGVPWLSSVYPFVAQGFAIVGSAMSMPGYAVGLLLIPTLIIGALAFAKLVALLSGDKPQQRTIVVHQQDATMGGPLVEAIERLRKAQSGNPDDVADHMKSLNDGLLPGQGQSTLLSYQKWLKAANATPSDADSNPGSSIHSLSSSPPL